MFSLAVVEKRELNILKIDKCTVVAALLMFRNNCKVDKSGDDLVG